MSDKFVWPKHMTHWALVDQPFWETGRFRYSTSKVNPIHNSFRIPCTVKQGSSQNGWIETSWTEPFYFVILEIYYICSYLSRSATKYVWKINKYYWYFVCSSSLYEPEVCNGLKDQDLSSALKAFESEEVSFRRILYYCTIIIQISHLSN